MERIIKEIMLDLTGKELADKEINKIKRKIPENIKNIGSDYAIYLWLREKLLNKST